jgi:hypothetical protein
MPDDELLGLAEAGKLHEPAVLDAQVKRMMTDKKAGRLRRQFRRPVAGSPQPRFDQARPEKFPAWTPELKDECAPKRACSSSTC